MTFANLTNKGSMPSGPRWWFVILVPAGSQGVLYADMVLTIVP